MPRSCARALAQLTRVLALALALADDRLRFTDWKGEYVHKALNDTTTRPDNSVDLTAFSGYSHGQFGNRSADFVLQAVAMDKPFFAYIGTTGPHLPCIPAPWHMPTVATWNITAPRLPTFNFHAATHHPTIAALPDLTPAGERVVDQQMRDRWGTLLSVDDLVAGVIRNLEELAVLDKTYVSPFRQHALTSESSSRIALNPPVLQILFSSDHGYHLGNYRLPMEKMWPCELEFSELNSAPGSSVGQPFRRCSAQKGAQNIDPAPYHTQSPALLSLQGFL